MRIQWIVAPVLALGLGAGAATASVVAVTLAGTITGGTDNTTGASLVGQDILTTYFYDTSVGILSGTLLEGGAAYGTPSPVSSSSDFGSVIFQDNGSYQGTVYAYDNSTTSGINYYAADLGSDISGVHYQSTSSTTCSGASGVMPLSLVTDFSALVTNGDLNCTGTVNGSALILASSSYLYSFTLSATYDNITISTGASPVPLPAGGALMLGALSALGLMKRRKARRT